MLAAGDDQRLDFAAHRLNRTIEVRHARKHLDLRLVGEQQVDLPAVDQRVEAVAVALDAEGVG